MRMRFWDLAAIFATLGVLAAPATVSAATSFDNFASAITVPGPTFGGDNTGATGEPNEPNHANASLRDAVAELLQSTAGLPQRRRVIEQTLSSNTGAYSRARSRLETQVAVQVADQVYQTLVAATPPSWRGRRACGGSPRSGARPW